MIFPTLDYVYIRSIIDWEWLYKEIAMLSIETSHTLNHIENMEFFKVNNLIHFTNEYLEAKNGDGNNSSEIMDKQQQNMSASMQAMKNTFKAPKIK